MLHLLKYRFIQIIRDYSVMFWALAFPMILGTFFYFSFGTQGLESTGENRWESVPVAVVEQQKNSREAEAFLTFLNEIDGDMISVQKFSSKKEALLQLKEENISGIYYADETPSLTVGKSGLNESILTSLLETYNLNSSMLQEIALTHPEKIADALETVSDYRTLVKEVSVGGIELNPNVQYFFALIAYACLSGVFLSVKATFDGQANLSPLGARRSITPTHKLALVLIDMFILVMIHFVNILILSFYIIKILGVSLGNNIPALLLVNFMGSTIGIAIGLAFGCIGRFSLDIKLGFSVVITLLPGFLAGLMFGNMKNIIEVNCPVINRINPAAVLSDAYYCLGVYNDMERFRRCLFILGIMSIGLTVLAFSGIRRERYDSI